MKTTVLTILALLLAIPTFGISLIVWFFAKYKYDKFMATRVLINAAIMSYNRNGETEVRYAINNGALGMLFSLYGGKILTNYGDEISGIITHPVEQIPLLVTMKQASENRLFIQATSVQ